MLKTISSASFWQPVLAAAAGVAFGVLLEKSRRRRTTASSSSDVVRSGIDVVVDKEQLEELVASCLRSAGTPPEKAKLVARVLVAADCRGIPSHGVNRAEMYCGELKAGLIDPTAEPTISSDSKAVANVDGNNGLGAVVSQYAMQLCIQKAKTNGIGLVVCHNSNHFGIAGFWSELALREGLIGFAFTNTSPFLVPTRACSRAGGTNPIACYCPGDGDSFQLDMATTTVPVGKVEVCHRKGQQMPHGWGVDTRGASTTKPKDVLMGGGLTPLGGLEETAGYKGYGLNMMVEILCGVLSGCTKVGPAVPPWRLDRGVAVDYGHCFMCIDPQQLLPSGNFQQSLSAYLRAMRSLPSTASSVLVPGDPEKAQEASSESGVRLNRHVALGLRSLARTLGCAVPGALRDLPEDEVPLCPHV
ncbi:unnamed protein product [Effrenium voratum]|nr:unnamed protein product [Effrenium voratum]